MERLDNACYQLEEVLMLLKDLNRLVFRSRDVSKSSRATTQSWTLPLWIIGMKSPSVAGDIFRGHDDPPPEDDKDVMLHKRVAKQVGFNNGDTIEVEIPAFNITLALAVKLVDSSSDFTINGALFCDDIPDFLKSERRSGGQIELTSSTGIKVTVPNQDLFSGLKVIIRRQSGILYFDGGCRNNPKGPAGYGYCIKLSSGEELIKGYGYMSGKRSSNYMEYAGLIEGLTWALRLNFKSLEIRGDSELILKQVSGEYRVDNPRLKECFDQVQNMMTGYQGKDVEFTLKRISRDQNNVCDALANKGMDRKENKTGINWENVNSMNEGR